MTRNTEDCLCNAHEQLHFSSPRIKVCFISPLGHSLYRPDSGVCFGGAEVQFFLLSKNLSLDPTFAVSILTTTKQTRPTHQRYGLLTLMTRQPGGRLAPELGTSLLSAWRAIRGYSAAFHDMWNLLRRIDADIYFHAGAGVEVGAYALICRLLHRQFVYVVASSADVSSTTGQVRGLLRSLFPIGIRLAHAVVCRTQEQCNMLRKRHRRDGILIRTGHPIPHKTAEEKETVLWVGRVHPLKQPELFFDLVEQLPQERCVMVAMQGESQKVLHQRIRQRAARLPNLTLLEDVPWNEMSQHFKTSKVLVNTSLYEGFPNTFVEVALQGTPILSWAVNPDKVLTHHRIGICAEGSFETLVKSAQQLCVSSGLRAELGERALQYARQYHDLETSVTALKTLIHSLMKHESSMTGRCTEQAS